MHVTNRDVTDRMDRLNGLEEPPHGAREPGLGCGEKCSDEDGGNYGMAPIPSSLRLRKRFSLAGIMLPAASIPFFLS
jgi:hypothetical protein